jgi:hypothetical protein
VSERSERTIRLSSVRERRLRAGRWQTLAGPDSAGFIGQEAA